MATVMCVIERHAYIGSTSLSSYVFAVINRATAQIIYFGAILLTTTLFEEDEHCGKYVV